MRPQRGFILNDWLQLGEQKQKQAKKQTNKRDKEGTG